MISSLRTKRALKIVECQRATSEQWAKFITASRVIKIMRDEQPAGLAERLNRNCFEENRKPGIRLFFDCSCIKKGRQALENRLMFMRSISYPWNKIKVLSDDVIRLEMKATYFTYLNV